MKTQQGGYLFWADVAQCSFPGLARGAPQAQAMKMNLVRVVLEMAQTVSSKNTNSTGQAGNTALPEQGPNVDHS